MTNVLKHNGYQARVDFDAEGSEFSLVGSLASTTS